MLCIQINIAEGFYNYVYLYVVMCVNGNTELIQNTFMRKIFTYIIKYIKM